MQFAHANGITVHYALTGARDANPLIVFINSLGTDFRIWDEVYPHFATDFSVLRYDKRGHGLSDLGTTPYTIDQHVTDLLALLDQIGAREIVVCGLSVGGLIAHGLYARRPEIVRALILCDTAPKIGTPETWNARIDAVMKDGIDSIADSVLERWFTAGFREHEKAKLAGCRAMLVRQSREGYAATCAALRDADYTEIAKSISVPALCLVGDQDGSTPPDLVRSMADMIPVSRFEVIADAGHIPCIEQPTDLVARIRSFLGDTGISFLT